ncbi:hypothetical protein KIN20_030234 [Parelaphostrongylus tenuis]|uniref:Uncharacterized protein n=1 Tax=Parelaphostrongylus tenuis TaxID=148309 RepID=A0AAD5R3F3_PARTN|nr:hypothetical protein KIN20_030234 [Parelaphostrongylus tenuis]
MVRLTVELIDNAPQFINTVRERELNLRGYKIPVIENMGITKIMTLNDWIIYLIEAIAYSLPPQQQSSPDIGDKLPNLKILSPLRITISRNWAISDPLANCKKLEYVTKSNNSIKTNYRAYIIYRLPSVRVVDFKRIRLAEREAARKLFKGKRGQKARDAIKRSTNAPRETENGENTRFNGSNLSAEDRVKIQNAIASARSLAEVEYLQSILASGRIPEKGWNRQMLLPTDTASPIQNGQFVPEVETTEYPVASNSSTAQSGYEQPHDQSGGGHENTQLLLATVNGGDNGQNIMETDTMDIDDDQEAS